jgi:hypothetical protein
MSVIAVVGQVLGIILAVLGIVYTLRSLFRAKPENEETTRELHASEERERKILERVPMASERASEEYLAKHPKL